MTFPSKSFVKSINEMTESHTANSSYSFDSKGNFLVQPTKKCWEQQVSSVTFRGNFSKS